MAVDYAQQALLSAQAKLRRADEHARQIQGAVDHWSSTNNPHTVRRKYNQGERPRYEFIVVPKEPLDKARIGVVFGDFINNLRGALDCVTHAAALASGASVPQKSNFPIANHINAWPAHLGPDAPLHDIEAGAADIMLGWQPFEEAANWPDSKFVGVLQHLNNRDKHRGITFVVAEWIKWNIMIREGSGIEVEDVAIEGPKPDADHMLLGSLRQGRTADFEFEDQVTLQPCVHTEIGEIVIGPYKVCELSDRDATNRSGLLGMLQWVSREVVKQLTDFTVTEAGLKLDRFA